ncbi:MAG: ABC transporter ATP-binding protein [Rhodospirillales bacterium]
MASVTGPARLVLTDICKSFPGCIANDGVSLTLAKGSIQALLGENGAGKSTLVKIIYGVQAADSGTIAIDGQAVRVPNPATARALGVGMVFQHFSLFDSLTVAENVALGIDDAGPMAELASRISAVSERYGLALDPRRAVHDLSSGERQRVEIVRCLLQDPRIIIMDEPTSVLTPQEADQLFVTLRRLRDEGRSILYISHKLDEIRALCDAATVMRAGRVVAHCDPRSETAESLARLMIGSDLPAYRREATEAGPPRLEVSHLDQASEDPFGTDLVDVGFTVRAGEILGIAGIAGNGQRTLLSVLSGETLLEDASQLLIDGEAAGRLGPRDRRERGFAFVPEERLGHGSVPDMDLAQNTLLSGRRAQGLVTWGLVRSSRAKSLAAGIIEAFRVVAPGPKTAARSLSGGNLQKFIMGREILKDPGVLVCAHPTWGVDAGAQAAIHQALLDLRARGAAILVVSQDLDELLLISDRIAAISGGHLSPALPAAEVTVEKLGLMMGGAVIGETEAAHAPA